MRHLGLVAFVISLFSLSAPASAFQGPCPPQSPFRSYDGCGPHGVHVNRGVINGRGSVMPYAVRMPPGPLRPHVYYSPRVRGYGGGYASAPIQTGVRVDAYEWHKRTAVTTCTRHTVHRHCVNGQCTVEEFDGSCN